MPQFLKSLGKVLVTIGANIGAAYLGLWLCVNVLNDRGKCPSNSSFFLCFIICCLTLIPLALILRSSWRETVSPLPIPIAIAYIFHNYEEAALLIFLTFGSPILIAAVASNFFHNRGKRHGAKHPAQSGPRE